MDHDLMWAPWRMSYVTSDRADRPECVFCAAPQAADDADPYILRRGRTAYVIMNLYPYNNGHLMVVPYRHVPRLTDLDSATTAEIMDLAQAAQEVLQSRMHPHGFNLGMNQGSAAGAGIEEHLHLHIVPRWVGDTNFMPAIGDTRVMPQHLDETYELLREGFTA